MKELFWNFVNLIFFFFQSTKDDGRVFTGDEAVNVKFNRFVFREISRQCTPVGKSSEICEMLGEVNALSDDGVKMSSMFKVIICASETTIELIKGTELMNFCLIGGVITQGELAEIVFSAQKWREEAIKYANKK